MTLRELKLCIQEQNIPDTFFVFVCANKDYFLASSYIEAICAAKQLERTVADSIFTQDSALSLVMSFENDFRVVYTETFEEACTDYSRFTNTAVICSKVDKKLASMLKDYIIEIPAVVEWQVKDFIKQQCPALTDQSINELYLACGNNMYYLDNMLTKIKLFEAIDQNTIAFEVSREPGSHMYDSSVYAVVDAIVSNNPDALQKYLLTNRIYKEDFLGIVGLALSKVRNLLFVGHTSKTAAELGLSDKQYYTISKTHIPSSVLQHKLKVLSSLDLQLKSGLLDISNPRQIDYLIMKLVN